MAHRWPAVLAAVLLAVAACESDVSPSPSPTLTPNPSPTAPPNAEPTPRERSTSDYTGRIERGDPGGEVRIGDLVEPMTANPYATEPQASESVGSALWAGLLIVSDDLRYTPNLSLDVPTVDNGGVVIPDAGRDAMVVEWWLKPDLKWSDGEPLTCDDFRFARDRLLASPDLPDRAALETLDQIECRGDQRMIWHFSEVYEGYLGLLQVPLPRHYLEDVQVPDPFAPAAIGGMPVSGPFAVESWEPGVAVRLIRNRFHRGIGFDHPALLDRLTFSWFTGPVDLIEAFRGGAIDVALGLAGRDAPAVYDLGDEAMSVYGFDADVLRLNWAAPSLTADLAVRKAVMLAVDRRSLASILEGEQEFLAGSSVSPAAWWYSEQPAVERDLAAARTVMADAGWIDADGDGRRERDGRGAELVLCTSSNAWSTDVGNLIAEGLAEIGIATSVQSVPAADLEADYASSSADTGCNVARGNYDIALQTLRGSIDPRYLVSRYHSSQWPPAGLNYGRIEDPELDAALDGIQGTVSFRVVKQMAAVFQERAATVVVEVPIVYTRSLALVDPRVGNLWASPNTTWNAADWFVRE